MANDLAPRLVEVAARARELAELPGLAARLSAQVEELTAENAELRADLGEIERILATVEKTLNLTGPASAATEIVAEQGHNDLGTEPAVAMVEKDSQPAVALPPAPDPAPKPNAEETRKKLPTREVKPNRPPVEPIGTPKSEPPRSEPPLDRKDFNDAERKHESMDEKVGRLVGAALAEKPWEPPSAWYLEPAAQAIRAVAESGGIAEVARAIGRNADIAEAVIPYCAPHIRAMIPLSKEERNKYLAMLLDAVTPKRRVKR